MCSNAVSFSCLFPLVWWKQLLCTSILYRQCHILPEWVKTAYMECRSTDNFVMWQPSWPSSLSLTGLTLWPSRLKPWFPTLLSTKVVIPVGCWCRDFTMGARPGCWLNSNAMAVHSQPSGCPVSGLMWMVGYQRVVCGAIEEGRNVTTQLSC